MKKLIIIILLLFSLNITPNSGYINISKQRNPIVYIINYQNDDLTTNTLDKTKKSLVEMYLNLLIEMQIASKTSIKDTS
ncbi:MAG: hypothetical protein N2490_03460 [Ignavibacteria bacterium]|nr:hypothetical protein [Ignavibacteria bacterium]